MHKAKLLRIEVKRTIIKVQYGIYPRFEINEISMSSKLFGLLVN